MFRFQPKFFILNIILLSILIFIAMYVRDRFIRPFLGDVLVVIWLYAFLKSWLTLSTPKVAFFVLIFACSLELGQYFNLVAILGMEHIKVARIIIGSTYDPLDLVAYFLGWIVIMTGNWFNKRRLSED